jgi:hypothetical protein
MDIRTAYNPKPIRHRNFDWEAVDYDTLDCDSPVGYGSTEESAIADLLEQLEEVDDDVRQGVSNSQSIGGW